MSVTLYYNPKTIWVTHQNFGVNKNLPMHSSDFKLWKNSKSDIDFVIRGLDRKPINLVGKNLFATIINPFTNETLFQRELIIDNLTIGKAKLNFFPGDTQDLKSGMYRYSISIINEDSSQNLLYTDQNYSARGYFEISDGALPEQAKAIEITSSDFSAFDPIESNITSYRTGAFPGSGQFTNINNLHTIVVYTTNFSGNLIIQGTLSEQVGEDLDWFDINVNSTESAISFNNYTGISAYNFSANLQWIRFVYQRIPNNDGTIDKILFKN